MPRVAELCRLALAEAGARERGGPLFVVREGRPEPAEPGLRAELADPDAMVVAGTFDGAVFGFATGRVEALRDGSHLGVIAELFVDPEVRAVGVGEAMMTELLGWFQGRGCRGVDATALPGDRQTKNFFEGSGFTARLLVMHHRMEG